MQILLSQKKINYQELKLRINLWNSLYIEEQFTGRTLTLEIINHIGLHPDELIVAESCLRKGLDVVHEPRLFKAPVEVFDPTNRTIVTKELGNLPDFAVRNPHHPHPSWKYVESTTMRNNRLPRHSSPEGVSFHKWKQLQVAKHHQIPYCQLGRENIQSIYRRIQLDRVSG